MARLTGPRLVAVEKITNYLLDPAHPRGASKARFFMRFGFDRALPDRLAEALRAHPDSNEVVESDLSAFGKTCVVRCHLASPDGRNPCIQSVWVLETGSTQYRLVTAYPADP